MEIDPRYDAVFTYEQSLKKADEAGLDVKLPAVNQLFIDIDTDEQFEEFNANKELVYMHEPGFILDEATTVSKSGLPGRHIILTVGKDLTDFERIAFQAILGSDRKREMLSWLSFNQGHEHPTLFFEKKQLALPPAPSWDILRDEDIPF